VCKGLVIDHMHRIRYDKSFIATRPSHASYGILGYELYDRDGEKHLEQSRVKNPLDGKLYVENKVDWLIHTGQKITEGKHTTRTYSRMVSPGDINKDWRFGVVTSALAKDELPQFWPAKGDVEITYHAVSNIGPNLDKVGSVSRRRHIIGPKFRLVEYDLLAVVERDELKFEIRIKGDSHALGLQRQHGQTEGIGERNRFQDGFIIDRQLN